MPNFYNILRARKFTTVADTAIEVSAHDSATPNFVIEAGGRLKWSSGSDNADTTLYRSAANTLKTDDSFDIAAGHTYKIDGDDVLTATTLGSTIVNSSLTSLGNLTSLTAATPNFTGPTSIVGSLNVDGIITADNIVLSNGSGLVESISDLGDVDFPTEPTEGQALIYSGTTWINSNIPSAGAGSLYTEIIGTNTASTFVVTHNLGTRDVFVSFRENGDNYENLNVAWEATNDNSITVNFGTPPALDSVKVLVYGSVSGAEITNLNDIGDVNIGSATPGQVLSWNGTSWVNADTSTGTGLYWNEVGGNNNASFGENVLDLADSSSYGNIGIGDESLKILSQGDHNIAIGYGALNKVTTSSENIAIGKLALTNAVSSYNIAIGSGALFSHNGGFGANVAIGWSSSISTTTGNNNTAVGSDSLRSNTTGAANNAFGAYALSANSTGNSNVSIGQISLENNTNGSFNVAVGNAALRNNITGSGNVAIGYAAGLNETGSNKLYIHNSSTSDPLIYGDFSTNYLKVNGSLEVVGTMSFQQTTEKVNTSSIASNVMTCDYTTGAIYYQSTNPSSNFTVNFTNVPTTNNKAITFTIFVTQGATAYLPNAVQIDGSAQTIKWGQGTIPTPTANKIDIFSFTLIRLSSSWTVFGNGNTNF